MKKFEYDLNKILPKHIQRRSDRDDEGRIYDELRLSPVPIIISGGQSGVDSEALKAASFLGLPAYAIMPKNGRRENGTIEDFQRTTGSILRKIELASNSYRFRTYANVYFSDVTVIYDFVGKSEGTLATIDACISLDRPYLLLSGCGRAEAIELFNFLKTNLPNVINFAGNSQSKISEQIQESIYLQVMTVLKRYCYYNKNKMDCDKVYDKLGVNEKITVAIPNFSIAKNIFRDFFRSEYDINLNYSSNMVYDFEKVRLVVARAREIINLVNNGVDIGFVGGDLCIEYDYNGEVLLDTGLIPNHTVLVSRSKAPISKPRVCSQYPSLARNFLDIEDVAYITGSAETYLSLGIYDMCVDSYQTGRTISQNGLMVNSVLKTTSLVMIGRGKNKNTEFYRRFIRYLCKYEV